ncbi:hypothetical protein [Mycolicibacterium sp. J2]|uniref:hypothetical protein n=1 Tax=Mycolicibacterium sp. J2 TaxID=2993511 RepID=UPI00224B101B|nr:hypothetical protein [Mycolicibacterium sp. J2]MCX2715533.1 hypothetical protein [Mycolicibacterium sp. J2]
MRTAVLVGALVGTAIPISPSTSAEPSWTMPNLIGKDLQGAAWFTSSTDLTGNVRAQINDRNW